MVNFNPAGAFKGISSGPEILNNPTSLAFGPDGRLYVAEQNGTIHAFTVALDGGEYVATAHEKLVLDNGFEVVKSIQNYNDDGSFSSTQNRQVTGIVVTGTAANPVLYVSSSDPRIAVKNDKNLDTNSGVITRVTWNGSDWEAVDIIRGLPRSEENHSVNGMVLSADGTSLYVTVGGNTNNGAASEYFSYTAEYALSGTLLEIDLTDINSRPILTDSNGGQAGTSRQYIYDLPTLDDPTVPNDGVREDENGLDVAGPWGGNDGLNMAILPADAPLSIYADGFRNHYDIVLTESGKLYTVDNGSNGNLGGDPPLVNGEATQTPQNGGSGDPEPLFLIEKNGYYGHPNPARSNQNLAWTVYNNDGSPDGSISPNSVSDLSALVPNSVNIEAGFLIDPSRFTGDPSRLKDSGIRIERDSAQSNALVTIGSSSNGLVEYTGNAFGGALKGDLLVAQFNGNIGRLDLNPSGTSATYSSLIKGLSVPLDVTTGPGGTIWVAEIGGDFIKVFAPSDLVLPDDPDFDNDGIDNVDDPFIRDASNGTSVVLFPGQTLLWDFDANQDNNLPGPDGYGGGLTGVMVNGATDFEQFFQEPSSLAGQDIKLDNVKFITAAGGGTTVIENVSNGDPSSTNDGEYLFHTGVKIAPTVDTFTVKWSLVNPGDKFTGAAQQIGGYIGTGDQFNFLKVVAIQHPSGEFQMALEDDDVVQSTAFFQADDVFSVAENESKKIWIELTVDPLAATATPTITYETAGGSTTLSGSPMSLAGTAVLEAIRGTYTVQGNPSGLAVGLYSSNVGQSPQDTFQVVFDDVEISATGTATSEILYRVNAGGPEVAAIDGGPNWSADTKGSPSPFLVIPGSNSTNGFPVVAPGATVSETAPASLYDTERWEQAGGAEMQWAFAVPTPGLYQLNLFMGNGFSGTNDPGERVFDVSIEGTVPVALNDIDLVARFGHQVGGMITTFAEVTDGILNLEFLHGVENPLINGIEILKAGAATPPVVEKPAISIVGGPYTVGESEGAIQISLLSDVTVPSNETVTVNFEIVPITATPGVDYSFDSLTGYAGSVVIAGGSSDATFFVDIEPDNLPEGSESFEVNITSVSSNAQIGETPSATVTIVDDDLPAVTGAAVLTVTVGSDNIQHSNFGSNSFKITNVGDKTIAKVEIDVTNALYPDSIFDPFGIAGDSVAKPLTINTAGGTGIIAPSSASYIGAGGTAGYKGLQLLFAENSNAGFNPGETIGFAIDMDPNSIAGTSKSPLDGGSSPTWDVGGVSGAELIGSTFTVTFTDGTTATGQLQGAGNQAGSQGIASQSSPNQTVSLMVNGLNEGTVGTYGLGGPSVVVNGPAGQTARVVLTKGFIQPVEPYNQALADQLAALAATDFPANNAVEFQTVDVLLTGADQDISGLFDFSGIKAYDFPGEDQIPIGLVASIIDPDNEDLPLGPVTQPIYLSFEDQASAVGPLFTTASTVTVLENQTAVLDIQATDDVDGEGNGLVYTLSGGADQALFSLNSTTGVLSFLNPPDFEAPADSNLDNVYDVEVLVSDTDNLTATQALAITVGDVDEAPGGSALTIQAESIIDTVGYRIENDGDADGGAMLSLVGGSSNEIGTASFIFSGPSGQYNVVLGTFDENDGVATLEVLKNNISIGSVKLMENPGGNAASANTKVELTVAGGKTFTTGDVITVKGFENAGEHARFDFIRFEPTSNGTPVAPVIVTGAAVTVFENQMVVLDIQATDDFDSEGNELTYTLSGGADQALFSLNSTTGVLSFLNPPDFEAPADSNLDNVYDVEVSVSDSDNLTATQSLAITVSNIDEAPGSEPISTILYRVNAGGPEIAAIDDGPNWSADTKGAPSPFLINPGSNSTNGFAALDPGPNVPSTIPGAIYNTERWEQAGGSEMQWAFNVPKPGFYQVNLFMGNGFGGTNDPGERVFDVAIEGIVPAVLDNIDLSAQFGHQVGGVVSTTVEVTDGILNLEFLHGVENPLINGIEILQVNAGENNLEEPELEAPEPIKGDYVDEVPVEEADSTILQLYNPISHSSILGGGFFGYEQLPTTPLHIDISQLNSVVDFNSLPDLYFMPSLLANTLTSTSGTALDTNGLIFDGELGYSASAYFNPLLFGTQTPTGNTFSSNANLGYAGFSNYAISRDGDRGLGNILNGLTTNDVLSIVSSPEAFLTELEFGQINSSFPILDATKGFTLDFELAISEEESSPNRAGFSLLLITDSGQGIELGFKDDGSNPDYVFAQDIGFANEAENSKNVLLNLKDKNAYKLTVEENAYSLFANGNLLLQGNLRDYEFDPTQSSPPFPAAFNPYEASNLIFLGDNTDQGYTDFELGAIALTTAQSTGPEEPEAPEEPVGPGEPLDSLKRVGVSLLQAQADGHLKVGDLTSRNGNLYEIGMFVVDDANGTVDGVVPGDASYLSTVLEKAQIVFSSLTGKVDFAGLEQLRDVAAQNGQLLSFFISRDRSLDDLRAGRTDGQVLFANAAANLNGFQALQIEELAGGEFRYRWRTEDGAFDDLSFDISFGSSTVPFGAALQGGPTSEIFDLRGQDKVTAQFKVFREAVNDNLLGFYKVADAQGNVMTANGLIAPGQAGYREAILASWQSLDLSLTGQNGSMQTYSFELEGNMLLAPFLLVNGANQVPNSTVTNDIYTPFLGANPNGVDHVRLLGSNIFGFEDLRNGGDRDFNDIIVQGMFT